MLLNIVICDDLLQEAQNTATHIQNYYKQRNLPLPQIKLMQTGAQLRQENKIDLLFLDIELEGESGIDLAAEWNKMHPETVIVFVSSYPFYVTDTYTVKAAQFFVKPLQADIFEKEFSRILHRFEAKQERFVRRCHGEDIIFHKEDIVYMESYKRIIKVIFMDHSEQQYYGKIGEEEESLTGTSIIRCHKGFLVNLNYIYGLTRQEITVQFPDGTQMKIPIGRNRYETVKVLFLQFVNQN